MTHDLLLVDILLRTVVRGWLRRRFDELLSLRVNLLDFSHNVIKLGRILWLQAGRTLVVQSHRRLTRYRVRVILVAQIRLPEALRLGRTKPIVAVRRLPLKF